MAGLTLDSGALIAFERGDQRVRATLDKAFKSHVRVTVPTIVVAEVWKSGPRSAILAWLLNVKRCETEPLTLPLARQAGELMTRTGSRSLVDAIVVMSAARRGDDILTQDLGDDMRTLASGVRNIRIVSVQ